MPLYEYQCPQCHERVELLRSFSDATATDCPKCGTGMKKLMSAPAIQFKGSGFYKTDYAAGSKSGSSGNDAAASSSSAPASTSATAASSSESKSESKSETKSSTPTTTSSNAD